MKRPGPSTWVKAREFFLAAGMYLMVLWFVFACSGAIAAWCGADPIWFQIPAVAACIALAFYSWKHPKYGFDDQ